MDGVSVVRQAFQDIADDVGVDAIVRPAAGGEIPCRVLAATDVQRVGPDGALVINSLELSLPATVVPYPRRGDRVDLDGQTYRVEAVVSAVAGAVYRVAVR